MVAEFVGTHRCAPALRAGMRIALFLSTAALAVAAFAACASLGAAGAVTANAPEASDRVVWDCGWRTIP